MWCKEEEGRRREDGEGGGVKGGVESSLSEWKPLHTKHTRHILSFCQLNLLQGNLGYEPSIWLAKLGMKGSLFISHALYSFFLHRMVILKRMNSSFLIRSLSYLVITGNGWYWAIKAYTINIFTEQYVSIYESVISSCGYYRMYSSDLRWTFVFVHLQ